MKYVRIALLVLILVGIVLLCTQKFWVPVVTQKILPYVEKPVPMIDIFSYSGPGCCHIVNAEIKTIPVPIDGLDNTLDIIVSMDGVSDRVIQEINGSITFGIFNEVRIGEEGGDWMEGYEETLVDARLDEFNSKMPGKELGLLSIDRLESKILYIDKGVVTVKGAADIYFKGAAHSFRGEFLTTYVIAPDGASWSDDYEYFIPDTYEQGADGLFLPSPTEKVITYFYPDAHTLINARATQDEVRGDNPCFEGMSPGSFYPDLDPVGGLVVFRASWGYAMSGVCDPATLVFTVPFVRLHEVGQYIPHDSILRRFMD